MKGTFLLPRLALAAIAWLAGQNLSASSICATVSDGTGAPLSRGAWVTAVNLQNPDESFSAEIDRNGKVCLDHGPDGLFSVEASTRSAAFLNSKYYPVRIVFPEEVHLSFQLPIGEISEGGVGVEATLTGTLKEKGKPVSWVRICLFKGDDRIHPVACTETNDAGQYALIVPPGKYRAEVSTGRSPVRSVAIDLPGPYRYRDLIPSVR